MTINIIEVIKDRYFYKFRHGKLILEDNHGIFPVKIYQNKKYRWLTFGTSAVQSAIELANPSKLVLRYQPLMVHGIQLLTNPNNCLVIGIGGGDIINYLANNYPSMLITAIDIDPNIVAIAKKYFVLPVQNNNISIIINDASIAIPNIENSYDCIMIDLYTAQDIPNFLYEELFYQQCMRLLSAKGIIICNLVCNSHHKFLGALAKIRSVFNNQTLFIPIKAYNNIIVYAFKEPTYNKVIERLTDEHKIRGTQFDINLGLTAKYFY